MYHLLNSISQRISLPVSCALCHQYHKQRTAICFHCCQHLNAIQCACYHCALPIPAGDFLICGQCCKKKPAVDHVIAAYAFEEPLRTLLHEFKYHESLYLCSFLARLIIEALPHEALSTQCLLPVPMHPKRLRQRGFNQAAELTKYLGRALKIPYDLFACKKVVNTAPQASLNGKARQKNLQNAFSANALPYQHITLIDDLLTTGNTVNELAKILKRQGVQRVDVWCCARTIIQPEAAPILNSLPLSNWLSR